MTEAPHTTTGSIPVLAEDDATTPLGNPRRRERLPRTSLFVAVVLVGAITLTTIVIVGVLLANNKEAPDGLIALAGTGLGSLGTFLARGQGST